MLVNNNNSDTVTADTKEYVTNTFRLNKKIIEIFRKESEKSGVSINALVNQVLFHYVDWDSFQPREA
jgi:predicted HicB family RNase H-like nuclease